MYDSVHQAFVQAMMCRKIIDWKDAVNLLQHLASDYSKPVKDYELQQVIEGINGRVRDLKMQLRDVTCEVTGNRYCTLVMTVETHVSRLSSKYKPNELQLFHKILDGIVTSNNGYVLLNTCINLTSSLPEEMTKTNAEAVIKRFIEDKWFIEGNKGSVYLGARCITELEPIIWDLYGDYVGKCPICQRLAIVGKKCNSCFCRTHIHCIEKCNSEPDVMNDNLCLKCGRDRNDSLGTSQMECD